MEQLINSIKTALSDNLPGIEAQYDMAPLNRNRIQIETLKQEEFRPSAVMILFCEDALGQSFIPLTERMTYKGVHSGQVSLPGGKYEQQDGDLLHTAIRECQEEIGVKEIEVLGKLTPLFIPVSGFLVHPFVGFCPVKNPGLINQEREVKRILKLLPEELLNNALVKEGNIQVMDAVIKTPWFEVEGQKVWGATAMILNELKVLMKTIA